MRKYVCDIAVIGAGCAGWNAMDELLIRGADAMLFCDDINSGVSLNSGSDKQTYYKLALSGGNPDSVEDMARAFFAGGSMQGHHARALAANSARCFMKLALLGVPFPRNEWGEYVGYHTDHDFTYRATSAGPLTSRYMAEKLRESALSRGARVVEGARLISILTEGNIARGALFMTDGEPILVIAGKILLATGAPAEIYSRTVFPANQTGATGAALRAGAISANLCYWQYGLASVGVRWNVSGSYQQAIPEYVDARGAPIAIPDKLNSIFLKGYQWPFDSAKVEGSARVDIAVKRASDAGGRVFMDFTKDPVGDFNALSGEAREYLSNCGALIEGAHSRLLAINAPAAEFYRARGIDLARERLEIALCAQHSNGGIWVDANWMTSVSGLYAAGECAGVFGAYRPGGSALNETQVGSLRAVERMLSQPIISRAPSDEIIERELNLIDADCDLPAEARYYQSQMDKCAGAARDIGGMRELLQAVNRRLDASPTNYRLRDILITQKHALSAMLLQSKYAGDAGHIIEKREPNAEKCGDYAFICDENGARAERVSPIPEGDQWFERVWKGNK